MIHDSMVFPRFWADVGFGILSDLAGSLARPTARGGVPYALGALRGVVSCVVAPPRYEEPPAAPEYEARVVDLADLPD